MRTGELWPLFRLLAVEWFCMRGFDDDDDDDDDDDEEEEEADEDEDDGELITEELLRLFTT